MLGGAGGGRGRGRRVGIWGGRRRGLKDVDGARRRAYLTLVLLFEYVKSVECVLQDPIPGSRERAASSVGYFFVIHTRWSAGKG